MSRAKHRNHALVFALLLALFGLVGLTCKDFVTLPTGEAPPVSLKVEVEETYSAGVGFRVALVDLLVTVDAPIQAIDLTLTWDTESMVFATALAHEDFDDDGVMFDSGTQAAGQLSGIIDLRHGLSTLQGQVRVASLVLFYADDGEPVTLRAKGSVVGPAGDLYEIVISKSATVTPTP